MPDRRAVREWLLLRPWQRHSLVVAVAGGVYVTYGLVSLALTPASPERTRSLQVALWVLPQHVWAAVWVVVGVAALASARWPVWSKTWGYTALSMLAAWWGFVYGAGVLVGAQPSTAAGGLLVWWLVAFLWWAIAGLVNPDDVLAGVADRA